MNAASKIVALDTRTVRSPFNDHNWVIPRQGLEAVAFLSCIFPNRRTDRVFELPERRQEPIIKQAQEDGMGSMSVMRRLLREVCSFNSDGGYPINGGGVPVRVKGIEEVVAVIGVRSRLNVDCDTIIQRVTRRKL
jgi:Haem-degrading